MIDRATRFLPTLAAALVLAVVAPVAVGPRTAHADDELITACDAGVQSTCVLDTAPGNGTGKGRLDWTMTVRCETDPARYAMSTDGGADCTVNANALKLDADRTFDLPVNKSHGAYGAVKRYACFALDDGGIPQCKVYKQPN